MTYRYLALTDPTGYSAGDCRLAAELRDLGLEDRAHVRNTIIYASKETPTLCLPCEAVLIGDLYDRRFDPVVAAECLGHVSTPQALRQHLLDRYWGEYLLIQPSDAHSDSVIFMRDPSGGVSCAYADSGRFVTSDASVAARLGLHGNEIDWEFVRHCLMYPYMKISRTGLAGISELLPGCLLAVTDKRTHTELAWSPWRWVEASRRHHDPAVAAESIRDVTNSVVRVMADKDKSVLLELSGGLDSSIVGACLAGSSAQVTACNAASPLPGADERHYAEQVARQLGVELLHGLMDFEGPGVQFPLPKCSLRPSVSSLAHMAALIMDGIAERQASNSLYSGGGGDSVFCYLRTAAPATDALLSRGLTAWWQAVVNLAQLHGCTVAKAARLALRKLCVPAKPAYRPVCTLLVDNDPEPPLTVHPWFHAPKGALPGDRERIFDLAGNQLFADVMLRDDHRRVRMPLLSQPVMEACLKVPTWMWIAGGRNRAVARAAFRGLLPDDVLNRRSKGTFMSYSFAMYRRKKETIRRFLLDGQLHSRGLLDADKVNRFLDTPLAARDQSFMRVFDLCMIENWLRSRN